MYRNKIKPFCDWCLALLTLVFLLPLFVVISAAIKIGDRGPVFFLQKRLGKNGRVFNLFKFRSMKSTTDPAKSSGYLYENDPRITKVGKFIRRTSLDELPQIFNILKGEMSFIGPRPPTVNYPKAFNQYNAFELKRFSVKPGISGLAQIRCREIHDWNINIPIDVEYVQNLSFRNDVKLFLHSLPVFFMTNNVYQKKETERKIGEVKTSLL